jgi:hypothetical protein
MEIVKVQTPVVTNDPNEPALVYARFRKHLVQQHLGHATREAMGSDLRAFFEAEYQAREGVWFIGDRVADQKW